MNRKRTLALILAAATLLMAFPIPAPAGTTDIGIKTGVAFANVFGGNIHNQTWRAGYCGGLFLTHEFSPGFAIQPEIQFVMKGSRHSEGSGATALYEIMSIEYMENNLLARLRLPVSRALHVHLLAGPSVAFNIRARVNSKIGDRREEESLDNVKGVDIGAVTGVGVIIPVRRGKICLDLRYTFGFSDISKGAGEGIRNGAACLFVGYIF